LDDDEVFAIEQIKLQEVQRGKMEDEKLLAIAYAALDKVKVVVDEESREDVKSYDQEDSDERL
jgi:hypothetical protein